MLCTCRSMPFLGVSAHGFGSEGSHCAEDLNQASIITETEPVFIICECLGMCGIWMSSKGEGVFSSSLKHRKMSLTQGVMM